MGIRDARALLATIGAGMTISMAGLLSLAGHEGIKNHSYPDPAHGWAVPTVCVGHTRTARPGQWRSDKECLDLLREDAEAAAQVVLSAGVPLTQGELDAYISFVFNVGSGNWSTSTLLRKLQAGDRHGACKELLRWTRANGVELDGLAARRAAEYALCKRDLPSVR